MELTITTFRMSGRAAEDDESQMVALAVTGDRTAFEEIVVRPERRILTLTYRLLGNLEDAKDAAQETFLRAYKYLRRFDPSRPLEPWLVGMAVNVCRNAGKNRQRRRLLFVSGEFSADHLRRAVILVLTAKLVTQ